MVDKALELVYQFNILTALSATFPVAIVNIACLAVLSLFTTKMTKERKEFSKRIITSLFSI